MSQLVRVWGTPRSQDGPPLTTVLWENSQRPSDRDAVGHPLTLWEEEEIWENVQLRIKWGFEWLAHQLLLCPFYISPSRKIWFYL